MPAVGAREWRKIYKSEEKTAIASGSRLFSSDTENTRKEVLQNAADKQIARLLRWNKTTRRYGRNTQCCAALINRPCTKAGRRGAGAYA